MEAAVELVRGWESGRLKRPEERPEERPEKRPSNINTVTRVEVGPRPL